MAQYTEEDLIKAIRADKLIGKGSCTSIDECYEDKELWGLFGIPAGNMTLEAALKDAYESEDLHWEQGLNARWGEDDDPQLKEYEEWQKARADHAAGGDDWESEKAKFEADLAASVKTSKS